MVLNNIFDTGTLTILIDFNSNVKEFFAIRINSPIFNLVYVATFIWWVIKKNPSGLEITTLSILVALIVEFYFKGE